MERSGSDEALPINIDTGKYVEKDELYSKLKDKTNKKDTEMLMRMIDTLHKMMDQLSAVVTQNFKDSLDGETSGETNKFKMHRK